MSAAATVTLRTSGLNLWFGRSHVLRNVGVEIHRAAITALIGPSGCGKTTLLRCFNRLNERYGSVRTTGEVTVLGEDIYAPDVCLGELRRRVGMVFQRPNPLPMSVYDNVVFGLRVHSAARALAPRELDAHVEAALRQVSLWDALRADLGRDATRLTLEQQQKLCIARLLPLKPDVILMDEPCSALDAEGTAAVEELIAGLRDGYTIVIVTHNMAQARRISDECVFMLLGEVVEQGLTLDVFLRPQRPETEAYVEGRYG